MRKFHLCGGRPFKLYCERSAVLSSVFTGRPGNRAAAAIGCIYKWSRHEGTQPLTLAVYHEAVKAQQQRTIGGSSSYTATGGPAPSYEADLSIAAVDSGIDDGTKRPYVLFALDNRSNAGFRAIVWSCVVSHKSRPIHQDRVTVIGVPPRSRVVEREIMTNYSGPTDEVSCRLLWTILS